MFCGPPDLHDRTGVIQYFLRDIEHTLSPTDLNEIAVQCEGWSGADLESLCREAALVPLRGIFDCYHHHGHHHHGAASHASHSSDAADGADGDDDDDDDEPPSEYCEYEGGGGAAGQNAHHEGGYGALAADGDDDGDDDDAELELASLTSLTSRTSTSPAHAQPQQPQQHTGGILPHATDLMGPLMGPPLLDRHPESIGPGLSHHDDDDVEAEAAEAQEGQVVEPPTGAGGVGAGADAGADADAGVSTGMDVAMGAMGAGGSVRLYDDGTDGAGENNEPDADCSEDDGSSCGECSTLDFDEGGSLEELMANVRPVERSDFELAYDTLMGSAMGVHEPDGHGADHDEEL